MVYTPKHSTGATPLFVASQNGYTEIVKQLIRAKADVNAANKNGATPLQIASQKRHTEIAKLLRAHGAR